MVLVVVANKPAKGDPPSPFQPPRPCAKPPHSKPNPGVKLIPSLEVVALGQESAAEADVRVREHLSESSRRLQGTERGLQGYRSMPHISKIRTSAAPLQLVKYSKLRDLGMREGGGRGLAAMHTCTHHQYIVSSRALRVALNWVMNRLILMAAANVFRRRHRTSSAPAHQQIKPLFS